MSKNSMFTHITKEHILQALSTIDDEGYSAKRKSTSYNLVHNNKCYPPKYVTSLASFHANGDFLTHDQFGGGEESKCFEFLRSHGFEILSKSESKDIPDAKSVTTLNQRKYVNRYRRKELDEPLFKSTFEKYLKECRNTDWLTENEAYKFRFGRWLTSRVDFERQTDQEIFDIIQESQEKEYTPGLKDKGINFINIVTRYHDDFISIEDVALLRKMRNGYMIEEWDLKETHSTWPIFSVWAGLFIPEHNKIIAKGELMKGFIYLFHLDNPGLGKVRGFNRMNTYLNHLAEVINSRYKDELTQLVRTIFEEDTELLSSDLAWFVQDYMFYLINKILKTAASYYWVNQGEQFKNELEHSCICADVASTKPYHTRLKDLKVGDILIHYADKAIKATSIVRETYKKGARPYTSNKNKAWVVLTDYTLLPIPIPISQVQERLRPNLQVLPSKHSPFDKNLGIVQAYCLLFNKPSYDLIFRKMHYPLNTILYGPPGTGKTYHSINYAVGMIEGKSLNEIKLESRSEIRRRYNEYMAKGNIVFTTFHQSMSYEDFIEGIKPTLLSEDSSEQSDVKYEIKSGIFKELVEKSKDTATILDEAKKSLYIDSKYFKDQINKISLGNSKSPEDNEIYEYCIKNNCVALGWGENFDYSGVKTKSDIRTVFESDEGHRSKPAFNVDAMFRFILWMKKGQLVFIPNGNKKLRAIGVVTGDYYFDQDTPIHYSQFRPVKWLHTNLDIPIKSIYSKFFSQQSIYQIYGGEIDQTYFSKEPPSTFKNDRYVLIIDEINRGNVSQIFGELITLIENDKRLGRKEALSIKLPYSKEMFSVPDNIFILGTMNTADRSVEALDTALRRRFSFVEMPSKPELLKTSENEGVIEDIDLIKLLSTINLRVSRLLDTDHAIGHSYFFKLKSKLDLEKVFKDRVIPLLEEYFFGDLKKIGLILGASFISESEDSKAISMKTFSGIENSYDTDLNSKKLFAIAPSHLWDYKDIYSA